VAISALTGAGFQALLTKIDEALPLDTLSDCTFRIPAGDGGPIHTLHEHARVISTRYTDEMCVIRAATPESIRRRLAKYLVA
jgi:50S ribosomal subunit-associated GTPase HflX